MKFTQMGLRSSSNVKRTAALLELKIKCKHAAVACFIFTSQHSFTQDCKGVQIGSNMESVQQTLNILFVIEIYFAALSLDLYSAYKNLLYILNTLFNFSLIIKA